MSNDRMKFRAYHKKYRKMYDVLHLHLDSCEGIWATCRGFDVIEQKDIHIQIQPKDCIIIQCTGLKDKTGKLLFEGDIVKCYTWYCDDEPELNEFTINPIVWGSSNSYPAFDIREHEYECNGLQYFVEEVEANTCIEIIGNIHENPELLGETL